MSLFTGMKKRNRWVYPRVYDPQELRRLDRRKRDRKRPDVVYLGSRGRVYKPGTCAKRLGKQIAGPRFHWLDPSSIKTHRRC